MKNINNTKSILICSNCKSDNVQIKMWVNPNTNKIIDSAGDGEDNDNWCEDCQGFCNLDIIELKSTAKIIGFQVIDEEENIHPNMESNFCVYNLEQARKMLINNNWKLLTIWDDDIKKPIMMFSGKVR